MTDPAPLCNPAGPTDPPNLSPRPAACAWTADLLLHPPARALRDAARLADDAQDPLGIDALPETGLHSLIADAYAARGLGVAREQPYPSPASGARSTRDRLRCDLALTPTPPARIADRMQHEAWQREIAPTLFAGVLPDPAADALAPEHACWVEIKTASQFSIADQGLRPNPSYTSEISRAPADDVDKLAHDPRIVHAAVLLIAFHADRVTARHDLAHALRTLVDRALPIRTPSVEGFPIADRIGHTWCSVVLIPLACVREQGTIPARP